jgi:hypothetical protein
MANNLPQRQSMIPETANRFSENECPGLDPGSCSIRNLERDDYRS